MRFQLFAHSFKKASLLECIGVSAEQVSVATWFRVWDRSRAQANRLMIEHFATPDTRWPTRRLR